MGSQGAFIQAQPAGGLACSLFHPSQPCALEDLLGPIHGQGTHQLLSWGSCLGFFITLVLL